MNFDSEKSNNKIEKNKIASLRDIPLILLTFIFVIFAWIFFRAQTINEAFYIIKKIVSNLPLLNIEMFYPKRLLIIGFLIIFEWLQRDKEHPLYLPKFPKWIRYLVYFAIILSIFFFGTYNYTPFIYFQF
ncbi:hypothetical protein KKF32_00385 [Patescibacteria group bacterium]|nr:hypothetical protein [Patescibacteria group bacterium]